MFARPDHSRPRTVRREPEVIARNHVVAAEEAGSRVDVVVARAIGAPRSAVAGAFRNGTVLLNGAAVKPSTAVAEGDAIEFDVVIPGPLDARGQTLPVDVVYEDEHVLVVNKAAGMVTHPAHGSRDGTLANALVAYAGTLPGDPLRPGLVHRLDRDTSGLLVIAKTGPALETLAKAMQQREIEREYLGLVAGVVEPERGTIEGAIARDPRNRLRFAIRAGGRSAVTHYEVRERLNGASEVLFRLETGRTHQIRVHMAGLGFPVLGDPLYGRRDPRLTLKGQALHAWRLRFQHPVSGEPLAFEVPPPDAYLRAREALRA